jgi:hypothetical protein
MGIDLSEIKGKTITDVYLNYDETEISLTFSNGSVLSIRSEGGHEVRISEVTSDWVFDPLEISYRK